MNVVNREIEMVAGFNKEGDIAPIRFRIFNEDDSFTVCTIKKVFHIDKQKIGKDEFIIFRCQITLNDVIKQVEVKYTKENTKWYLYRI